MRNQKAKNKQSPIISKFIHLPRFEVDGYLLEEPRLFLVGSSEDEAVEVKPSFFTSFSNKYQFLYKVLQDNLFLTQRETAYILNVHRTYLTQRSCIRNLKTHKILKFAYSSSRKSRKIYTIYPAIIEYLQKLHSITRKYHKGIRESLLMHLYIPRLRYFLRAYLTKTLAPEVLQDPIYSPYKKAIKIFQEMFL